MFTIQLGKSHVFPQEQPPTQTRLVFQTARPVYREIDTDEEEIDAKQARKRKAQEDAEECDDKQDDSYNASSDSSSDSDSDSEVLHDFI